MVDGLHIQNRTKKPLTIPLSGAGRGLKGKESRDYLTTVQYKLIWNCSVNSPIQQIYPNKKSMNKINKDSTSLLLEHKQQQMLARLQGKRNPYILLVEM
jgi:hypothetical protein